MKPSSLVRRPAVLAGVAVLLLAPRLDAAERRVPSDYPTIQQALDASAAGDTVRVAPGDYAGPLSFNAKDVTLVSEGGAGVTRILAAAAYAVNIGPGGTLSGFTVTPAPQATAGGIEVNGTGTVIRSNVFDGLTQVGPFGAAISGNCASPLIDGNTFRHQTADLQFLSGAVVFVNCSSPRIVNNLFVSNPCRAINLTLPEGNTPQVINNTFWGNLTAIRYDRRVNCQAQLYRNNLIFGNQVGLEVEFGDEANDATWENNLAYGNTNDFSGIVNPTGQHGNLAADPLLVDPVAGDFHLRKASPAIDAANTAGAPDHDLEGDARPVDGNRDGEAGFDIGADEFVGRPPKPPGGMKVLSLERVLSLSWNPVVDVDGYHVKRSLTSGGPYSLIQTVTEIQYTDTNVLAGTRYFYVVSAVNEFGEGVNSGEVTEIPGNLPPTPADDLVTTPEDTPVTVDVLANDTDPNHDPLLPVGLTQPANGTATNIDGKILFTPAPNFNGTNVFTYTVSDVRGGEASARVTVVVTPVNDPPTALDLGPLSGAADSGIPFVLTGNDVDGDPLTFRIVAAPGWGQIRQFDAATGGGVYLPAHAFSGWDSLMFQASDGRATSEVRNLVFHVDAPSDLDGNGLPDSWESTHDIGNPDADRDQDGMTNAQEYAANTDPNDPASVLRLKSLTRDPAGHFTLTWQSVGAVRYRVLYSNAGPGGGFVRPSTEISRSVTDEMDPAPPGTASTMSFTDDFTLTGGQPLIGGRFFQVRVLQEPVPHPAGPTGP